MRHSHAGMLMGLEDVIFRLHVQLVSASQTSGCHGSTWMSSLPLCSL